MISKLQSISHSEWINTSPGLIFLKAFFEGLICGAAQFNKSIGLGYSWNAKKKEKNHILPYRFSVLFYFVLKGNFSPGISSWGLIFGGRVTFIANIGRVLLIFRPNCMTECNVKR